MKCPINPEHGELMLLVRLGTHKYDRDTQAYCKTCKEEKSDRIQDLLIDLMYELGKSGDVEEENRNAYENRKIRIQDNN